MKVAIVFCLAFLAVAVSGENCSTLRDCKETTCSQDHGWFLHCTSGYCLCSHDTHTGRPCTDGLATTCAAIHDSRCTDHNLNWHCVDGVCHCSKL